MVLVPKDLQYPKFQEDNFQHPGLKRVKRIKTRHSYGEKGPVRHFKICMPELFHEVTLFVLLYLEFPLIQGNLNLV